jgi:hypothetical protein
MMGQCSKQMEVIRGKFYLVSRKSSEGHNLRILGVPYAGEGESSQ